MKVDFFCEYPEQGLDKAEMLNSNSVVYIAAKNVEEYRTYRKRLYEINSDLRAAYWPILETSYWVSPFSTIEDLESLKEELNSLKDGEKVLIDLELPLLNKKCFIKGLRNFRAKKSLIKDILELDHLDIRTAEYTSFPGTRRMMALLGVIYPNLQVKRGVMYYTSLWNEPNLSLRRKSIRDFIDNEDCFYIGVGTIGQGVFGDEPILSEDALEEDLRYLDRLGVGNVCVFRLGALNQEYIGVLRKFT